VAWFQDWSDTARAVVERRRDRILLGLAKRKSTKPKQPTPAPIEAEPNSRAA
jgi:hypothetical protein